MEDLVSHRLLLKCLFTSPLGTEKWYDHNSSEKSNTNIGAGIYEKQQTEASTDEEWI